MPKTKVRQEELIWETSKEGTRVSLAEVLKAVRKNFPKVPFKDLDVVASGFVGRDIVYRSVIVRQRVKT
jgi:hypothetical protein